MDASPTGPSWRARRRSSGCAVAGAPDLWVKRDDRCTPLYGGNKPRKLEFILGEAEARGARRVFTTGGIGTHHGLATTILARTCGMATTLVLVDQPVTDEVRESLRLFAAFGADVVDARSVLGAVALGVPALLRSRLRGERAYVVPTGGSGATGNLGFVSAALELAGQIRGGELPEPAALFLPIGSGGSVAGVTLGLRLAGLATPVVGVLATDILPPSPARLARLARATLRMLRRADPAIPAPALRAADFDVAREQIGPGYGARDPRGERGARRRGRRRARARDHLRREVSGRDPRARRRRRAARRTGALLAHVQRGRRRREGPAAAHGLAAAAARADRGGRVSRARPDRTGNRNGFGWMGVGRGR